MALKLGQTVVLTKEALTEYSVRGLSWNDVGVLEKPLGPNWVRVRFKPQDVEFTLDLDPRSLIPFCTACRSEISDQCWCGEPEHSQAHEWLSWGHPYNPIIGCRCPWQQAVKQNNFSPGHLWWEYTTGETWMVIEVVGTDSSVLRNCQGMARVLTHRALLANYRHIGRSLEALEAQHQEQTRPLDAQWHLGEPIIPVGDGIMISPDGQ